MIVGISAVTLGTHEMPRAVRFYRGLGFEVLHGDEESSFTSFRVGVSYLNLIAQPAERRWSWWARNLPRRRFDALTAVRSQQDTSQLPCPAMPNGESATSI